MDFYTGRAAELYRSDILEKGREFAVSRVHLGPKKKRALIELETALSELPPPSVQSLARRLGYKNTGALYQVSSELCKKITARYLEEARSQETSKVSTQKVCDSLTIRRKLATAKNQNPCPSVRQVALQLGYKGSSGLYARYSELCIELTVERARQRKIMLETVGLKLQKISKEEPPPSLAETTARLGYKHTFALSRMFSKECEVISSRYKRYNEAVQREKKGSLQLKLEEYASKKSAMSMEEVAKQLGYSARYLRRKFAILCKQISTRYRAHITDLNKRRREEIRARVHSAVTKLTENGGYPSFANVKKSSPSLSLSVSNQYFKEAMKEARRKANEARLAM
jgi:AraC-like DNA-binding protein